MNFRYLIVYHLHAHSKINQIDTAIFAPENCRTAVSIVQQKKKLKFTNARKFQANRLCSVLKWLCHTQPTSDSDRMNFVRLDRSRSTLLVYEWRKRDTLHTNPFRMAGKCERTATT